MKKNIKLSICIPTYNRASYLERCLKSILVSQDDNLEIIIQDNASPDNTEAVVKTFNDKRIKYFKNDTNIGGVRNAIEILEKASGDYVFYLTDDDFLFPNAIKTIKEFIINYKPSVFTTDILMYLEKKKEAYNYSYFKENRIFDSSERNEISEVYLSAHILTRCCFNKNIFSEEDYTFLKKNGTDNWYPQTLLIPLMYLKGNVGYLAEPIGLHTWENDTFWGINPNEIDILTRGHIEIIKSLKNIIDMELLECIILKFSLKNKTIYEELLDLLEMERRLQIIEKVETKLMSKEPNGIYKIWIQEMMGDSSFKLGSKLLALNVKNVIVFGTGELSMLLSQDFSSVGVRIEGYLDNNSEMLSFNNKVVYRSSEISEQEIKNKKIDAIVVSIEGNHDTMIIERLRNVYKDLKIISWKKLLEYNNQNN